MMNRKYIVRGVPFFIVIVIMFIAAINGIFSNKVFNTQYYIGLIGAMICLILFFIKPKWYKYAFLFFIVAGSLNLLHLTLTHVTLSISLGLFKLINVETFELPLVAFSILILYLIIIRKGIMRILGLSISSNALQHKTNTTGGSSKFEYEYSRFTKEELKEILDNKESYPVDAVTAARKLYNMK